MSNYVKKVLIEKGKLDRLQHRQIREFSFEVHNMADIRTRMAMIVDDKKLPADAMLSLLKAIQTQFDKLQKDIGLPSTGSFTKGSSEVSVKKVTNDTAVNKSSEPTDNEDTTEQEKTGEIDDERQSETDDIMSDDKFTPLSVQQLGIYQQYKPKASKLLFKIIEHPEILKRNDAGEMVVFGKVEPGTNFNNLFKSIIGPTRDLNQPGIDKFLEALRRLGVRSNELSGKELQLKYEPSVPRKSSQFQLAALKAEPSSITKTEPSNKYVKPTISSSTSCTKGKSYSAAVQVKQQGKGIQEVMPPGHQPKILYLY